MKPSRTILVVDDHDLLRAAVCRRLEKMLGPEWRIAQAADPQQAMYVSRGKIDVLLTDYEMPLFSGLDVVEEFAQHSPGTVRIMMSANLSGATADPRFEYVDQAFGKPFEVEDLLGYLRSRGVL